MDRHEFSELIAYLIPHRILLESAEVLRSLSRGSREAVVLWAGRTEMGRALVQRMIAPRQSASAMHFEVSFGERLRLIAKLAGSGEMVLAQLHTHPGMAFHSLADDRLALPRQTGAISIVVPDYGADWDGDFRDVSINRHLGEGVWQELGTEEAHSVLRIWE